LISKRALAQAVAAALLFGAATPAGKLLLEGIEPTRLAGWLYLGAALGVLPLVVRRGRWRSREAASRRDWCRLAGAIGCGGVLAPIALLTSLEQAPAGSVSLWLNLELVATAVLGRLVFRDPLGRAGWIGAAGVLAASILTALDPGGGGIGAVALVTVACVAWGFDNHWTALIASWTPAETTFWKGLTAGAVNLGLAGIAAVPSAAPHVAATALLVGSVSYGASIALYIGSAQALGATRAQIVFSTAPFFGAVLSWLVLGEPVASSQILGVGLIGFSLMLLFRDVHAHTHRHEAIEHEHWHRHDDDHHEHAHDGAPPEQGHSHPHRHAAIVHRHAHWHDLHHRHRHEP